MGVGKHDRDAIGAEDLRELRRRPLEELIGIALAADDRLKVARCAQLRLRVLLLTLGAPQRVRFGELETDELRDASESGDIVGAKRASDLERGETSDELVLPDDRRDRKGVGGAAVGERDRDAVRGLVGNPLRERFSEERRGGTVAPRDLSGKVVGDIGHVAIALHLEDDRDRVSAGELREVRHARRPEVGVKAEAHAGSLRDAGAGLALDP